MHHLGSSKQFTTHQIHKNIEGYKSEFTFLIRDAPQERALRHITHCFHRENISVNGRRERVSQGGEVDKIPNGSRNTPTQVEGG